MSAISTDYLGGDYTIEELQKIVGMGARTHGVKKPNQAFFQKNTGEYGPTWAERRAFVTFLIEDSDIQPQAKVHLMECEKWVPRFQIRGFKYGVASAFATYMFMPVVRNQPFVRRFAISMIPFYNFMKWGYVWGHENFWRRAKDTVVYYEIIAGTRSLYTMK